VSEISPQITAIGAVIQLAVAPVFLLTGVGIILTVLTNRLARVVDRARRLEDAVDVAAPDERPMIHERLRALARRARLMNRAITLSTISGLLVALVVMTIFLGAFLNFEIALPIAAMFILAMLALIGALLFFLREVFLAISTLRIGE
jgi:hypothetical protein